MPPEARRFLIAGAKVTLISYHPNILLKNFQNNELFSKRGRHTYIYIYKGAGRRANNRAGDANSRGYNKATGREDSEARGEQDDRAKGREGKRARKREGKRVRDSVRGVRE